MRKKKIVIFLFLTGLLLLGLNQLIKPRVVWADTGTFDCVWKDTTKTCEVDNINCECGNFECDPGSLGDCCVPIPNFCEKFTRAGREGYTEDCEFTKSVSCLPKSSLPATGIWSISLFRILKIALPDYNPAEGIIDITRYDLSFGEIISLLLPYVFILAGLILFILLIIGGFEYLTSGGDQKKVASAQARLTNAFVGFIIIFVSYWLIQLLETILGIDILE